MFTQPVMYKKIRRHPGVLSKYADQLVSENVITRAEFQVGQYGAINRSICYFTAGRGGELLC